MALQHSDTFCKLYIFDKSIIALRRRSLFAKSLAVMEGKHQRDSKRGADMTEFLPIRLYMYVLRKILLTTVSYGCNYVPFHLTVLLYYIPFDNTILACSIPLDDY